MLPDQALVFLNWEHRVSRSARKRSRSGFTVFITGAAGFIGTHVSVALKRHGEGVIGLDNFNCYYDSALKCTRQKLLDRSGVFVVEGDTNDSSLLKKFFEVVAFTHVMHLAAQAGVRFAMQNPSSYVHSNSAGFVNLLEVYKFTDPHAMALEVESEAGEALLSEEDGGGLEGPADVIAVAADHEDEAPRRKGKP